jgi:hypothetical protein
VNNRIAALHSVIVKSRLTHGLDSIDSMAREHECATSLARRAPLPTD